MRRLALGLLAFVACSTEPAATPSDVAAALLDGAIADAGPEGKPDAPGPDAMPADTADPDAPAPDAAAPPTPLAPPEALAEHVDPPALLTTAAGLPVTSASVWHDQRAPELWRLLQHYVYGYAPPLAEVTVAPDGGAAGPRAVLDGAATVEELAVTIASAPEHPLHVAVFRPPGAGPFPVWLALNACGNQALLDDPSLRVTTGWREPKCVGASPEDSRGTQASLFPVEQIVAAGWALVALHQSDLAPDDPLAGAAGVRGVAGLASGPDETRWGVLQAWAWGVAHLARAVPQLAGLDPARIAVVGHSRRGKVALLASVLEPAIGLVVAHQSGTAGARLSRSAVGEPVEAITLAFPHWFDAYFPAFARRETYLPLDQHFLLALVAPRPLLLTNGEDDDWAGPAGTREAAQLASPAWTLLGAAGLGADNDLSAPLAWHQRAGGHALGPDDWAVFLAFAAQHL